MVFGMVVGDSGNGNPSGCPAGGRIDRGECFSHVAPTQGYGGANSELPYSIDVAGRNYDSIDTFITGEIELFKVSGGIKAGISKNSSFYIEGALLYD